jgi:hypothetical protein
MVARKRFLLKACLLIPVVAIVTTGCKKEATPQDVSVALQKAIQNSDASAVARFVSEEEVQRLGVKREQLAQFFDHELFDKWIAKGDPIRDTDSAHTVTLDMSLVSKSGDQEVSLTVASLPGDNGVEVPQLVKLVIWNNAIAIARKEGRPTDPASRHRIVASYLAENASRLESSYGLKGLYYDDEGSVVTWSNIQKRYIEWADRVDARTKAGGGR